MSRSIRTWFILAVVLATAAQAALAAGPSFGKGTYRGSFNRPTVRAAAGPRLSQGHKPARITGSVRQLRGNPTGIVRSGNLGSNARNLTPRDNSLSRNLTARNRTPVDLGTPPFTPETNPFNRGTLPRTNPISPNLGTGNLVRNNPISGGNSGLRPVTGTTDRFIPRLPNENPRGVRPPDTGTRILNPGDVRVHEPGDIADRVPDHITPPGMNGGANQGNDEIGTGLTEREPVEVADGIGTGVTDLEPVAPDPELIVTDGDGVEIPGVEPVEDAPAPIDAGTVVSTISDLISQFAGGGGAVASDGGGYGVEEAADFGPTISESVDAVAEEPADVDSMDIELTEVWLVAAGSVEHKVGPRFRLFCRNNGSIEAPKFHVSVLVDASKELTETAHLVTVESVGMMPGKTQTVDVQLPVETLRMMTASGKQAKPFETFAAFIDSDNSMEETDEDNNVLLLARDAIQPLGSDDVADSK